MKFLILCFFLAFSLPCFAITLSQQGGLALAKMETHTQATFRVTGSAPVPAVSSAVGNKIVSKWAFPAGGSLLTRSVVPIKNLAKSVLNLAKTSPWKTGLIILCAQQIGDCAAGVVAIKDWLKNAALGENPDGSFNKPAFGYMWSGYCYTPAHLCVTIGFCLDQSTGGFNYSSDRMAQLTAYASSFPKCSTGGPSVSVTDDEARAALESTPISEPEFEKVLKGLHEAAVQQKNPSLDPEGEQPEIPDSEFTELDGNGGYQKRTPQPDETEVTPDGKVIKKQSDIVCKKTSSNSCDCQKVTNYNITNNDNTVINKPVENVPSDAELGSNGKDNANVSDDFCDKHPDIIGCAKFGDVPTKETIPTTDAPITLSPTSLGSGTCPAPKVTTLSHGRTITMSYQPECDFATKINPIIVSFAWLAAGFIVVGSIKEG